MILTCLGGVIALVTRDRNEKQTTQSDAVDVQLPSALDMIPLSQIEVLSSDVLILPQRQTMLVATAVPKTSTSAARAHIVTARPRWSKSRAVSNSSRLAEPPQHRLLAQLTARPPAWGATKQSDYFVCANAPVLSGECRPEGVITGQ